MIITERHDRVRAGRREQLSDWLDHDTMQAVMSEACRTRAATVMEAGVYAPNQKQHVHEGLAALLSSPRLRNTPHPPPRLLYPTSKYRDKTSLT